MRAALMGPADACRTSGMGSEHRAGWGEEVDSQTRDGERKGGAVLRQYHTGTTGPHC